MTTASNASRRGTSDAATRDVPWWCARAHLATLALALIVLVVVNRHQWFNADEWNFLLDRGRRRTAAPKGRAGRGGDGAAGAKDVSS